MSISIKIGKLEDVLYVNEQIPEFDQRTTLEKLQYRLLNKKYLLLVAYVDNTPIGYKLGYELCDNEFYSWLGGVASSYRKQGIAKKLRIKQEQWAIAHHYQSISVKSMNQYPAMLHMLIASDYKICGYQDNGSVDNSKIKFSKMLAIKTE